MPKDLTKLSLRELETVSGTSFDQRLRWDGGTLELTVHTSEPHDSREDGYDLD